MGSIQATGPVEEALLDSITHDLRTPLVSIQGALTCLQEEAAQVNAAEGLDPETRRTLIDNAAEEAERLNYLIGNLIDMARVQAGALQIVPTPCDIAEVIGCALERIKVRLGGRSVEVQIDSGLVPVPMDLVLMVQVLVHVLDNAIKYSPPGSPIEIQAHAADGGLRVSVSDRGIGIPTDDLARVFDKFYRVSRIDGVIGTGLGLAICRRIVEAQRGTIEAAKRGGGGTVVTINLPLV